MMILVMMMTRVMTVSMSGMSRCCSNILINVDNPHSDIHTNQGARLGFYSQIGYYGARPQYKYNWVNINAYFEMLLMCRQDGGKYLIFYSSGDQEWLNTEFSAGNTTSGLYHVYHKYHVYVYHVYHALRTCQWSVLLLSRLWPQVSLIISVSCLQYCIRWVYYNGSDWLSSSEVVTQCSVVTDVCCSSVKISSTLTNITSHYSQVYSLLIGWHKAILISDWFTTPRRLDTASVSTHQLGWAMVGICISCQDWTGISVIMVYHSSVMSQVPGVHWVRGLDADQQCSEQCRIPDTHGRQRLSWGQLQHLGGQWR